MIRYPKLVLAIFIIFLCSAFVLGRYTQVGGYIKLVPPSGIVISYSDLIVILLTCLAILLTTLGVGIAILTIFGWRRLKESALQQAEAVTKANLDDESSALSLRLTKAVQRAAYDGITPVDIDTEEGD